MSKYLEKNGDGSPLLTQKELSKNIQPTTC